MPTAVEFGGSYTARVLNSRSIPEAAVQAVVARGRGVAIEGGKIQYRHAFTDTHGFSWGMNVICDGSVVVSSWLERL